ncbi:MAG: hypothetical protein HYV39_01245 [Candidatus Levybacteria bacterium]|nr:hypothetical protein [Candidatus Levybacteria bacterium]
MKQWAIFLSLLFLIFHLLPLTSHAQEPRFVPDEVIVKYKNGQSPDDIKALIQQKHARKKTIIGFLKVFFEDLTKRIKKQETIEDKLKRLEDADKKMGVISRKQLFANPPPQLANIYLIKLKEKNKVLETIELYKALPEVEYAEPNHILRIMQ